VDVRVEEKGYEKEVGGAGDLVTCQLILFSPMAGDEIACPTVLLDQGQFSSPAATGFPSTYAMMLPNSLFLIQ